MNTQNALWLAAAVDVVEHFDGEDINKKIQFLLLARALKVEFRWTNLAAPQHPFNVDHLKCRKSWLSLLSSARASNPVLRATENWMGLSRYIALSLPPARAGYRARHFLPVTWERTWSGKHSFAFSWKAVQCGGKKSPSETPAVSGSWPHSASSSACWDSLPPSQPQFLIWEMRLNWRFF